MKKSLAICLLLLGAIGCGLEENTKARNANTEAIKASSESNVASADSEKTLPEDDHPAKIKDSTANDLSAALRGKRVHVKVGDQGGWFEFNDDGSSYHGRGDERQSGKAQWSASGNRVTFLAGKIENHMVFTDLTARPDSEVIFLNSADRKTKGIIVRVEAIPPASAIQINLERPGEREFVRDQAQMLDAEAITKIKEIADKLLTEKAIPILVVTIESMASCGAGDMRIETFATLLFDQWGIGVAELNGEPWNTGILLLVSKGDRKARIELGGGWGPREDGLCKQIMDEQIIYHFKQKNFSQGILTGVEALERMARKEPLPTNDSVAKKSGGAFGALFRAVSKSIPESITKIEAPQEIDSDSNNSVTRRVHLKSARITLSAYGKCLDLYKFDMNSYPDSGSGLRALIERPKALDPSMNWNGPYLSRGIIRDPWGQEYLYEGGIDAKEQQFYKIWSAGPNMQDENGKGDDIVQHSNQ